MYSTVHYTNANKSKGEQQGDHTLSSGTYSSGFNTFAMEWDPESLSFYVNDILVREIMIDDGMKEFLRDFYLIVNVAVGGNWPGDPDASTSFPQQMNIDYIRVFEKEGFDPPPIDLDDKLLVGRVVDVPLIKYCIPFATTG